MHNKIRFRKSSQYATATAELKENMQMKWKDLRVIMKMKC